MALKVAVAMQLLVLDRRARMCLGFTLAIVGLESVLLLAADIAQLRTAASPLQLGAHGRAALGDGAFPAGGPAAAEAALVATAAAAGDVRPPKLALLFLTRGPMPLEALWRLFLEHTLAAHPTAKQRDAWQHLFSVHVHPPPGYKYPAGSLFAGREVVESERVQVEWGQHSIVEAERALLRAALRDPAVKVLALLSESCIPLWPAAAVWLRLVLDQRSRINACNDPADPTADDRRQVHRWQPGMLAATVSRQAWRKSSQWASLTRHHAELVVNDLVVEKAFRKECWVDTAHLSRFCVSDEHYIPTLLAMHGVGSDAVDCTAPLTYTEWAGNVRHPHTLGRADASTSTLVRLRQNCSVLAGAQGMWRQLVLLSAEHAGLLSAEHAGSWDAAQNRTDDAFLPSRCPLFARKVAAEAAEAWTRMLRPVVVGDGESG